MNPNAYSEEERKDIEDRVAKAKDLLKELSLQPGIAMQMVNTGNDVFGIQPIAYLQDMLYTPVKSPLSP